ncbi:MAG TPA: MoxR family ATPase [Kofleriaceae bacterium]
MMRFHPNDGDQLARRTSVPDYAAYVYNEDLILAVNAALATDRPLLLRGNPGCGKSTVAKDIALALDREYLSEVITSKTTATDLLWRFDAVGRLTDTKGGKAKPRSEFLEPGVLWRAFERGKRAAVVLLDEIDKADPDVPNDLLVPIGEGKFRVADDDRVKGELPLVERRRDVLVILTSNNERDLPPAFLRRCVALWIDDPKDKRLEDIVRRHLDARNATAAKRVPFDPQLLREVVARVGTLGSGLARSAGTAEILDAFKAAIELGIDAKHPQWELLTRVLLYKESKPPTP